MDGVRLLGVSRQVPLQHGASPTVLAMTLGNMVCDLYERAEFLGLEPDLETFKVEFTPTDQRRPREERVWTIRAHIEGASR